ncbi:hypothetical protein TNCV_1444061 [Trichonephila clavipes]|nr:hypothetical protein TNCV_1444061 [Trichonephila clavipes]
MPTNTLRVHTDLHAEIVEVEIEVVSPSIVPSGNFAELNRTVTCMVLKANDRRTSCPCHDEFRGPRSDNVRQNRGEKDEKKDQYLKSLPRRGWLEEENGRTRTKLEYITRARMEERRKGGLSVPKRVRGAPRTQWEGKCCYFFCAAGMKKKSVCKEKLIDATAGVTKLEPASTLIPVLMRGKCI